LRASLEPVTGWIEELRTVKSAAELALIRRSVETNSRAFEQAIARVKPGMSERDLAAELEYRMRRLGAEKPSFETIVAAGARSALPHAQPTAARLMPGDLVVVDMGAFQDGYASDMTRMLSVGGASGKVKRMYRAVLEAQLAAIDAVRGGVATVRVDAAARRVLAGYGLDRAFIHSTGHGLGLEIHEPPRLGKRDRHRLRPGMAITIEPGAYIEGFGGVAHRRYRGGHRNRLRDSHSHAQGTPYRLALAPPRLQRTGDGTPGYSLGTPFRRLLGAIRESSHAGTGRLNAGRSRPQRAMRRPAAYSCRRYWCSSCAAESFAAICRPAFWIAREVAAAAPAAGNATAPWKDRA